MDNATTNCRSLEVNNVKHRAPRKTRIKKQIYSKKEVPRAFDLVVEKNQRVDRFVAPFTTNEGSSEQASFSVGQGKLADVTVPMSNAFNVLNKMIEEHL